MRLLFIIPLLLLASCKTLDTPEQKYYAITVAITEVGNITEKYVDTCKNELPPDDKCHAQLPRIHDAALRLQDSVKELDKVFVSKDSAWYNFSLTLTQNALEHLRTVIGE